MPYFLNQNLAIAVFACVFLEAAQAAPKNLDVRLLIDVSGSMQANDPGNLRVPAVRLVAELMPRGATGGIWTFSERVDPLVSASEVDDKWKDSVIKALGKIHSRGQFTDIEAALAEATHDWHQIADPDQERHLLLLTDGMVDVSKELDQSTKSRGRILGSQLSKLIASGVKIHTIALSKNSDRALLTTLAESTQGWAEQVDDAETLQRVFLHMFEQAAAPDTVPLKDNRFEVDSAISEMTLLVFNGQDAHEPLQLIDPEGSIFTEKQHPSMAHWRVANGYDLVSVEKPQPGEWRIKSDPDPDNRVLIVTDLKLDVGAMLSNYLAGENLTVRAQITERGKPVQRRDFLELLTAEMSLSVTDVGDELSIPQSIPLHLDSSEAVFLMNRSIDKQPGDYEAIVTVNGGTFKRQSRSKFRLHSAPVTFLSELSNEGTEIRIVAHAEPDLVDSRTLTGLIVISGPDGSTQVHDIPAFGAGASEVAVGVSKNGIYQIEAHVLGQRSDGRSIKFTTKLPDQEVTRFEVPRPVSEEPVVLAPPETDIDWMRGGAIVASGNAVIGLMLGVVWLLFGRRKRGASNEVVLA